MELCPTSKLLADAATSITRRPIDNLSRVGVSLSRHTDNRPMSSIKHSGNAATPWRETALTEIDLSTKATRPLQRAFPPEAARKGVQPAVDAILAQTRAS